MKRSELLRRAAVAGLATAVLPGRTSAAAAHPDAPVKPLPPARDGVPVAFLLSDGAVTIDFAGPWEVFQDADVTGRKAPAFTLYTVAESTKPIVTSGGLTIVPRYALADAPTPKVVVVPAQSNPTDAVKRWLLATAPRADLIMSVCTGALVLAASGLLKGRSATTHHAALTTLAMQHPDITVERGVRFVDDGNIATSAGLSAGIDLALHVVARYYGKEAARQTAYDMEYQSERWRTADNTAYLKPQIARAGDAICPVCWMEIDPKQSLHLAYAGTQYYFCMPEHERIFASAPQRFANA
ncbi:MAG: DJ-1/PfpI family protein [Candidatus Eremiobacteraeota bacterium]|nr:DJ-1/PfpI family protein [Candidatus Eremiobacteraeota bacterium]